MISHPYDIRQALVDSLVVDIEPFASAIILCGSLAYADRSSVTEKSDIDLIVITTDLSRAVTELMGIEYVKPLTVARYFEGVCIKLNRDDVKISIHILTPETLTIVSLSYVADIRLYRPVVKEENYVLKSFSGLFYDYSIKNIQLPDCKGYRTIVPIGFIQADVYYVGIHRDKLMSSPRIIKDDDAIASKAINNNWRKTYSIFLSEKSRTPNAEDFRLSACLSKYKNFSQAARDQVEHIEQELRRSL